MIAFVLSGGNNRGALQAGALLSLLGRGIRPDLIVATSVGALNGVALAADPTLAGMQRIAERWRTLRRSDIYPGNSLTAGWRILTGRGSLHERASFQRFIVTMLPPGIRRFGDLKIPCVVTATVLRTGQLRLFGADPQERIVDALLASTAIPPFFPPYRYGDEWLVDGAVVASLPLAQAIARGARTIYALEIFDQAAPASGIGLLQTLSFSLSAMLSRQHEQERKIAELGRQRGVAVHYIQLTGGQNLAYNDFSQGAALIESGERAAHAYLDALPAPQPPPYRKLATALRSMVRSLGARRAPAVPPA
jgi:NTE family protein